MFVKMNKEFGEILAQALFGTGIKQVPFAISYDAYEEFVSEWEKLNDEWLLKTDKK